MAGFYQNKAIMYCRRDAVKEYTGESHLSTAPASCWYCIVSVYGMSPFENSHNVMWKQYHLITIKDPTLMQPFSPVETISFDYNEGSHFNATTVSCGKQYN